MGVLRALATSGPVVIAIDDVQWLDVPSARVLAFVVRRLEDAPIGSWRYCASVLAATLSVWVRRGRYPSSGCPWAHCLMRR